MKEIPMDSQNIQESVLDAIQPTKNPLIWDIPAGKDPDDPKMIPAVRSFILDTVEAFRKSSPVPFDVKAVRLIGSNTTRQYKPNSSDLDINIDVTMNHIDFFKNPGNMQLIPKNVPVPGTNIPVNVFVFFADGAPFNPDSAQNIYNIITEKWEKVSVAAPVSEKDIPYVYISYVANLFIKGFVSELSDYRMVYDRIQRTMTLPLSADLTAAERNEDLAREARNLQADMDSIYFFRKLFFDDQSEIFHMLPKNPLASSIPFRFSIRFNPTDEWTEAGSLIYKYISSFKVYGNDRGIFEICQDIKEEGRTLLKKVSSFISDDSKKTDVASKQTADIQKDIIRTAEMTPTPAPTAMAEDMEETFVESEISESISILTEKAKKEGKDTFVPDFKKIAYSDPEVIALIRKMKDEMQKKKPDMEAIAGYRKELSAKVKDFVMNYSKKSDDMIADSFSMTDQEIGNVLTENGYAATPKNIKLMRSGRYVMLVK